MLENKLELLEKKYVLRFFFFFTNQLVFIIYNSPYKSTIIFPHLCCCKGQSLRKGQIKVLCKTLDSHEPCVALGGSLEEKSGSRFPTSPPF